MDKPGSQKIYEFEDFRLDAGHLMLYCRGEELSLSPKAIKTLLALVERRGKIVSKDELLGAVWPDTSVEESNLYLYLSVLRNTLGIQKNGRPYLETLRRRGYRFSADVRPSRADDKNGPCTENTEATRLYLLGRYHAHRLTPPDHLRAIAYFEEAIELAPDHPLPYVGIAITCLLNVLANDAPPADRMPRAKIAAMKAVELDPESSEAHIALGSVALFYDWEWDVAGEQLKCAYELDPKSGEANSFLAHFYSNIGCHDEAVELSRHAALLDPLNLRRGAQYGQFLYYAGKYDESIEQLKRMIELEPNFWLPHMFVARSYIEKGCYCEVDRELSIARQLGSVSLEVPALHGCAYARSGKLRKAREVLAELNSVAERRYVPPYFPAMVHNALGDKEQALDCLERSYRVRDARATWLKVDPKWNNLRFEPRFVKVLRKMHFDSCP
jgi:serine/threonine-protein kinase